MRFRTFALPVMCVTFGCGDAQLDRATVAKAFESPSPKQQALDAAEAKAKQAAQAKRIADEQAKATLASALENATIVPADTPKDLMAACDAVVDAYDQFMKTQFAADERAILEFMDGRREELGKIRSQCNKTASVNAAGCQINALRSAVPVLKDHAADLLNRCAEKFGAPDTHVAALPTNHPRG